MPDSQSEVPHSSKHKAAAAAPAIGEDPEDPIVDLSLSQSQLSSKKKPAKPAAKKRAPNVKSKGKVTISTNDQDTRDSTISPPNHISPPLKKNNSCNKGPAARVLVQIGDQGDDTGEGIRVPDVATETVRKGAGSEKKMVENEKNDEGMDVSDGDREQEPLVRSSCDNEMGLKMTCSVCH
jgi:hypothetical protein